MQSTNTSKKLSLSNLKDEVSFYLKKFKNSVQLLERRKELTQRDKIKISENTLFIQAIEKMMNAADMQIEKLEGLGKVPPQATDLEQAILGALILERNQATENVFKFLRPDHFYEPAHEIIYDSLLKMRSELLSIDMRTLFHFISKQGKIQQIGGAYYIAELTSKVSSSANIEYHARVVIEKSIKRKLIEYASEIHIKAYEDENDVFEILEWAKNEVNQIEQSNTSK